MRPHTLHHVAFHRFFSRARWSLDAVDACRRSSWWRSTVVGRCLEKRRENGYPDVDAALEDLRRAVRGERQGHAAKVRALGLYVEARRGALVDDATLDAVGRRLSA